MGRSTVKVRIEDGVAWVYLNRPEKKNALNRQMHSQILSWLEKLEHDNDVKVLVFTGVGDSFCAGLDVRETFVDNYADPVKFYDTLYPVASLAGWHMKLRFYPKPTIACVNGYCFAGAFSLLSACDLAVADETAIFGISEVNFGHIPAGGTTWSVAEFLLPKHALELILTGKTFDGKEAARLGLINRAVPGKELVQSTKQLANSLKEKNPAALRSTKMTYLLTRRLGPDLHSAIMWELAMLHENSYFTGKEWIDKALPNFKRKQFKPGFQTYKAER